MKLPRLKDLPKNEPRPSWPPFPDPNATGPQPTIPYKPRSNFYVVFNEDDALALMVDNDPIMVYIDVSDGGESEPRKVKINDIVSDWVKQTNRVPSTISYGDFTYDTNANTFEETRPSWRPSRGQENWMYDGSTFSLV